MGFLDHGIVCLRIHQLHHVFTGDGSESDVGFVFGSTGDLIETCFEIFQLSDAIGIDTGLDRR